LGAWGFADPGYELSMEWRATRARVLVIEGSARNDGSCPRRDIEELPSRRTSPGAATALSCTATWPASRRRETSLSDWLDWMGLVDAGPKARLERFIGYYEPYASSHDTLDRDTAVQEEARNAARAVATAVAELRENRLSMSDVKLKNPRPK
jgi:hypothetical protein